MHWTIIPRRSAVALAFLLPAISMQTDPVAAQETGERMKILVPALANKAAGGNNKFGERVASELEKRLKEMPKHQPIEMKELRDAFKKYSVNEKDLVDCIKARQLAGMPDVGIPLVMCGEYDETGSGATVTARIVSPQSGETFEVESFQASDQRQAADHIVASFETYVQQLEHAYYCNDYLESSNWQSALESCDRALEINAQGKTALYGKGQALWKLDRLEEALEVNEQLLEMEQGLHQDALLTAALIAAALGDNEKSDRYLNDYLELDPGNKDVRLKVATDAAEAGNPEGALKIIEDGLKGDHANDLTMLEYAGHFAMRAAILKADNAGANGNEAESKALLEKALNYYEPVFASKGSEVSATVLRNMLQAYRRLDQNTLAVDFGQKAVAAHPDDAQLLSAYADALNNAGRRDEAIAALNRVLEIDPNYEGGINGRRGMWLLQSGDLAGARSAFKIAIDRNELTEQQQDQLAQQVAKAGYDDKSSAGEFQAAAEYYTAAKELAKTPSTRGMVAFFEGYDLLKQADQRARRSQDLETARATLPMFNRILELMQQAAPFGATSPRNEGSRQQIIGQARDYKEIQELIIQRGR